MAIQFMICIHLPLCEGHVMLMLDFEGSVLGDDLVIEFILPHPNPHTTPPPSLHRDHCHHPHHCHYHHNDRSIYQ